MSTGTLHTHLHTVPVPCLAHALSTHRQHPPHVSIPYLPSHSRVQKMRVAARPWKELAVYSIIRSLLVRTAILSAVHVWIKIAPVFNVNQVVEISHNSRYSKHCLYRTTRPHARSTKQNKPPTDDALFFFYHGADDGMYTYFTRASRMPAKMEPNPAPPSPPSLPCNQHRRTPNAISPDLQRSRQPTPRHRQAPPRGPT